MKSPSKKVDSSTGTQTMNSNPVDQLIEAVKSVLENKCLYQNETLSVDVSARKIRFLATHRELLVSPERGPVRRVKTGQPLECKLPNITIPCKQCKRECAHHCLEVNELCEHIITTDGIKIEQAFAASYRCASCESGIVFFQIYRLADKLRMTGRSTPFEPQIAPEWPKTIRTIVKNGIEAARCDDVNGAYYHLRTAVEHHMKIAVGNKVEDKSDGKDLCDRYNKKLSATVKSQSPGMLSIYTELSVGLHARSGSNDRFWILFGEVLKHFKAKELFPLSPTSKKAAEPGPT